MFGSFSNARLNPFSLAIFSSGEPGSVMATNWRPARPVFSKK